MCPVLTRRAMCALVSSLLSLMACETPDKRPSAQSEAPEKVEAQALDVPQASAPVDVPVDVPGSTSPIVGFVMGAHGGIAVLDVSPEPGWFDMDRAKSLERASSFEVPVSDLLPARFAELKGQPFTVYDAASKPCTTRIESLSVVGEVVAPLGTESEWEGKTDEEVARLVMEFAEEEGTYLAARLSGGCEAPWVWGHVGEAREAVALEQSESQTEEVLAKVEALPGYAHIAQMEDAPKEGAWHHHVTMQGATFAGRQWVLVHLMGGERCTEFHEEFWALFERDEKGELLLRSDPENPEQLGAWTSFFSFTSMSDLDGDGAPELLGPTLRMARVEDTWRITGERIIPFLGCGC